MRETVAAVVAADPADVPQLSRTHAGFDLAFHQAILEAAGNRTVTAVVSATGMLSRAMAWPKDEPDRLVANLRRAYREHKAIYEAIRAGDAAEASAAMLAHTSHGRRQAAEFARLIAEGKVSEVG